MLFNDLTENTERSRDRGGTYKWPLWNLGRSSRVWVRCGKEHIRTINISNQQPTTNKKFKSFHVLTLSPWRSKAEKVCVFMSFYVREKRTEMNRRVNYTMHPKFILKKNDKDKDLMKFPASNRCTVLVDYLLLGALDPLYWHKLDPNSTPSIVESLEQGCHSKLPSKVESFCW